MKIAVTAASGRLGHALLRLLPAEAGVADVVAVARDPARVRAPGIEVRAGDYQSVRSLRTALQGIDTVVLISAPVAGAGDRVELHRNVLDAARHCGVRRVLFTSVVGNGLEMGTWFGATQRINRQTESDVQASGLEWIVGRNALYLELDLIQMRRAAENGIYSNPAGEGRCPYLSISEIAYAYARLAAEPHAAGHIYNISGETLTQAELLRQTCEVFGLDIRYEVISDEECLAKFARLMPERGEAVARMLTGCFQSMRLGAFDVPSHFREAAGRPAKPVRAMIEEIAATQTSIA